MKILVLGGYGFIGSHVCQQLKSEGHTIGVVDCYHQYYTFPDWEYYPVLSQRKEITNTDYEYIGQIENLQFMEQTFEHFKPDRVVHVATYPNARMVKRNVLDATNNMITATAYILDLCVKHKVQKIVYASSSMVYGEFNNNIPDETVIPKPNTLYGSYKRQGEIMCKIWHREHGLNYVIMRPSALYGEKDTITRVISQMLKSVLTTGEMTVQGPDNKLDFSNVLDVAKYFSLATTNEIKNETFNCTRGNGRKIIEAAEIIKSKLGTGTIITKPHDTFYPNRDTLNSDKAKSMFNFSPQIEIDEGIPNYMNWFLRQPFYFDNLDINKQFPLGTKI
jgi:nucleoside-diphosphate-sugar epimerase|tara:strand:+ start:776 stop:1777 length:1002 start_codon:yes stop_codon:yes gene_type:complete